MAVKIRMKKMGRKHRPFFSICATDARSPRDGKVLEELGTYDPMIVDTDARCVFNDEGKRLTYWLSVGAQPSDKVKVLIKKYGPQGIKLAAQQSARERLAMPKVVPDAGEPVYVRPKDAPPEAAASAAEAPEAPAAAEAAAAPEENTAAE